MESFIDKDGNEVFIGDYIVGGGLNYRALDIIIAQVIEIKNNKVVAEYGQERKRKIRRPFRSVVKYNK